VYSCYWSSPAQSFSGPSPARLMPTFYCLRSETPPTWGGRSPYLYPPGTGWPSYTARQWVPFRRLLRLAGLRWRYLTPPLRGICSFIILIGVFINLFRRNIILPVIILQCCRLGYLARPMSELISESTKLLDIFVGFLGRDIGTPSRLVSVQDTPHSLGALMSWCSHRARAMHFIYFSVIYFLDTYI
jgi:hypothetical protein